jgi:formylglycine-generating enzyme required for sulfatase activity
MKIQGVSTLFIAFLALLILTLVTPTWPESSAQSNLGWANERLPVGLKKSEHQNEYVWEKDGSEMVYVPAGKFSMGRDYIPENEKPVHIVNLDAFYIDKYEVTRGAFGQFVKDKGYKTTAERLGSGVVLRPTGINDTKDVSWRNCGFDQNDNHPVVLVSWDDAKEYENWAGKSLPTEAQWEKAASWDQNAQEGKKKRQHPWGDNDPAGPGVGTADPKNLGNFADVNFALEIPAQGPLKSLKDYLLDPHWGGQYDDGFVYTSPVGNYRFGQSPVGALDMAGNVWEWCEDGYDVNYYKHSPADNPVNTDGSNGRVIRGGAYDTPCPAPYPNSFRAFLAHDHRMTTVGFRGVVKGIQ